MKRDLLRIRSPDDLEPLGVALSALGVGVTLVDRDMRVRWANGFVRELAEELSCGGHHCFQLLWHAGARCPDCLPLLVFRTGEPQEGIRERGRPGAVPEAYRVRAVPILDENGALSWVAESFLRLSSLAPGLAGVGHLAAQSAAAVGAALIVVDRGERIVSWDAEASAIFGYTLEEALGRRIDLLVPSDRSAEERDLASAVERDGSVARIDTVRLARDGRRVPVALSAVALRDETGALIGRSCLVRDVSALQALRSRVAAQEQLLAHIGREAADAIVGTDLDGVVTSWNHAAAQLLGRAASDALGQPLHVLADDPGVGALLAGVRRGKPVRGQRTLWRDAGGAASPVEVSATLLRDGAGEPQGMALVVRDASASVRLERQMMRSEKLALVGSLAAGLAHEIGTPLNVISATAEYLILDGAPEAHAQRLRAIVAETERISRLVRELLSLARSNDSGRVPVAVGDAAERVLSFVHVPLSKKRVRVERDLPPDLPPVLADPDGLQQVLLNLVVNAVHAVGEGGRVGLRARVGNEGGERVVTLEVHDDGPGVPEVLRERIFDPFFTTRPDGTGLGLAVCSRVVASHGGDLKVGTGPWGGASFTVQFRAAEVGA
ncbi:MAG TPA: PAS domain-containing protein [Anaeromyxobacteraceae bacterium]|nr:PAS domain-containing protein [Anaeromyxobacteraceae bacterium]